jgi:hypothetical protein
MHTWHLAGWGREEREEDGGWGHGTGANDHERGVASNTHDHTTYSVFGSVVG